MIGKFDIIIQNRQATYKFSIKRNITILQGDSAIGKSFLLNLINRHNAVKDSGISLYIKSSMGINADLGEMTYDIWSNKTIVKNRIYFIEETQDFVKSNEFAKFVAETGIYVVIITRDSIPSLPYSINEIYTVETNDNLHEFKNVYKFNGDLEIPDVIITEDSKSGNEFFSESLNLKCIGSGGNGEIYNTIVRNKLTNTKVLIIADGAAFGPHIAKFNELAEDYQLKFYLPESFEWLILNAKIFNIKNLNDMLSYSYDYIEASDYFSWENFYEQKLVNITENRHYKYNKTSLADYYKTRTNAAKILVNSSLSDLLYKNHFLLKSDDVKREFINLYNDKKSKNETVKNDILDGFRIPSHKEVNEMNLKL